MKENQTTEVAEAPAAFTPMPMRPGPSPLKVARDTVMQRFAGKREEALQKAREIEQEEDERAAIVVAYFQRKESLEAGQQQYAAFEFHWRAAFGRDLDALLDALADQLTRVPVHNAVQTMGVIDPLVRHEAAVRHGAALAQKLHALLVGIPQKELNEFVTKHRALLVEAKAI